MVSTCVFEAASNSITSRLLPSATSRHESQASHGSGVGPFAQFRAFARIRAIVDHPVFGGIIVVLILLSVVLILVEAFGGLPPEVNFDIEIVNDVMTEVRRIRVENGLSV